MAKKTNAPDNSVEQTAKARVLKTIDESLSFFDFENERVLECKYDKTIILGKGKKDDEEVKAHVVTCINSGERFYLSTSYGINKLIDALKSEFPANYKEKELRIEFLEKTIVDGKPFNRFKTGIYE